MLLYISVSEEMLCHTTWNEISDVPDRSAGGGGGAADRAADGHGRAALRHRRHRLLPRAGRPLNPGTSSTLSSFQSHLIIESAYLRLEDVKSIHITEG